MASNESVKDLLKQQTLKGAKRAQLDKVYKWFTVMCPFEKPMISTMVIDKAMCFYDKIKITEKHTFCDGWL
jgi:hypothetical protein